MFPKQFFKTQNGFKLSGIILNKSVLKLAPFVVGIKKETDENPRSMSLGLNEKPQSSFLYSDWEQCF